MAVKPDFINQYILTKAPFEKPTDWKSFSLGEYTLYTHPVTETTHAKQADAELIVIGNCYDYRNPSFSNQQVIDSLNLKTSVEDLLDQLEHLNGIYLILWRTPDNFLIIPDLCCLREIFMDTNRSNEIIVAASPNLIHEVQPLKDSGESFYTLKKFQNRKVWVGNKTNYIGVTRLKPNHFLDIINGTVKRFFPIQKIEQQPLEDVVEKTYSVMAGFVQAMHHRHANVMLGLTGGWDSRFLLAASRAVHKETTYYINRSGRSSVDCRVAAQLADKFDLRFYELRINNQSYEPDQNYLAILPHTSKEGYALLKNTARDFGGYRTISGSGSEVARTEFGLIKDLDGSKLAALAKYPDESYCVTYYNEWLQQEDMFKKYGYDTLDLFYWEEILGNRVAKSISEAHTLGVFVSPAFQCRFLLRNFLSVDKKHRAKQTNTLYTRIIERQWKETLDVPVNPGLKKRIILLMQKVGVYDLYRNLFTTGIWK